MALRCTAGMDPLLKEGMPLCFETFSCLLQECMKNKDLVAGRRVHSLIAENDFLWNSKLRCHLIRMFASCGSMLEALKVFRSFPEQNVYTWTAIILAHTEQGKAEHAMVLYEQMKMSAVKPSSHTFAAILKACGSIDALEQGKGVHADAIKQGLEVDLLVGNAIVDMYGKRGSLVDARRVFDKLIKGDVVSWNTLIAGYVRHGHGLEGLQLFQKMQKFTEPNKVTFLGILKACALTAGLEEGKLIHVNLLERGLDLDECIGSTLIHMYANCGSLENAREVFDRLLVRDVVSWSAIIAVYSEHGYGKEALMLFRKMEQEGIEPNAFTFTCILKASGSIGALQEGNMIHGNIMKRGLESEQCVGNSLVDMYAKCGSLEGSRKVFGNLPSHNVVSWNTMIGGYTEHGQGEDAFQMFREMQQQGTEPNQITFVGILKACASIAALDQGKLIHTNIRERGLATDLIVGNTLIDMYIKCDRLEDARNVFYQMPVQDVVSWSAMIAGYADHGQNHEAFQLFKTMQMDNIEPNEVTFVCILKVCSNISALEQCRLIHYDIIKKGFNLDTVVGGSLIGVYAKCDHMDDAQKVFNGLSVQNVLSWSAMIAAYLDHGHMQEAHQLFEKMQQQDVEPNDVIFVCLLKAYASIPALDQGKLMHQNVMEKGLEGDLFVGNSLVDMYAKCGHLEDAHRVFEKLHVRDLVTWNSMIAGCANHGQFRATCDYFVNMQCEGIRPDDVTFVGLLSACSHAGCVQDGCHYFKSMSDYGIAPKNEHYVCMVDILGRAGRLEEAENFVLKMPSQPDWGVWITLLGSCAKHGNPEIGRRVFDFFVKQDCRNAASYALMSSIYAANYKWDDVQVIKRLRTLKDSW